MPGGGFDGTQKIEVAMLVSRLRDEEEALSLLLMPRVRVRMETLDERAVQPLQLASVAFVHCAGGRAVAERVEIVLDVHVQLRFPFCELSFELFLDGLICDALPSVDLRLREGELSLGSSCLDFGLEKIVFEASYLDVVVVEDLRVDLQLDVVDFEEEIGKVVARLLQCLT